MKTGHESGTLAVPQKPPFPKAVEIRSLMVSPEVLSRLQRVQEGDDEGRYSQSSASEWSTYGDDEDFDEMDGLAKSEGADRESNEHGSVVTEHEDDDDIDACMQFFIGIICNIKFEHLKLSS